MKLIWAAVALGALAGCALLKQGMDEAANGIPTNLQAIPEGTGWFCYTANERQWSGCWRTQDECNSERDHNKTFYSIDTLTFQKWGNCNPVSQAYCLTFEEMEMQSNGSSKPAPRWDCMPDDLSCSDLAESRLHETGKSRVSKCSGVK